MASFETTGILKLKRDTQQISEKYSKREFVITTDLNTQYPQYISMQLSQDKCALLDGYNIGDEIKVSFNLRGREYDNPTKGIQYFNSLEAWRLEKASAATASAPQAQAAPQSYAPVASAEVMPSQEIADDLPF